MSTIRVRTAVQGDSTTVRALIQHPMETGQRKDGKTGQRIPAHYITEVVTELNGEPVMTAHWGAGIAANPYLSFQFQGAKKGDTLKMSWVDNKGESDSTETEIG
ncbi:thiosulfate oxidation carrier complex protein SoxZ [Ectothiorhodospiraceae bacterium 2226]|nr:thiosulfate oxidation carrier complex protein SoxZ [Ectothiorhodospiraceae bacterium 2226]